jgi:predicted DNA-binding ribbon-helix-helix protein
VSEPRKISVSIRGHRTSISLEPEFWAAFRELCARDGRPMADAIIEIDRTRDGNLSGAVRLWVLARLRALAGLPDPTKEP